jgi:hypothetical protein
LDDEAHASGTDWHDSRAVMSDDETTHAPTNGIHQHAALTVRVVTQATPQTVSAVCSHSVGIPRWLDLQLALLHRRESQPPARYRSIPMFHRSIGPVGMLCGTRLTGGTAPYLGPAHLQAGVQAGSHSSSSSGRVP